MYELDKRTYKVYCPGCLNMVVDMPIDYRRSPQGWINLPCNGCDQMSGDPRCDLCRAAINDYLSRHQPKPGEIIHLRIEPAP